MQRQRKTVGEILVELGRITAGDVERALARQREVGGYFGDSLVALGLLTRDELKWTLAGQFDLPFVHLHPESIDAGVAAVVPAGWAREHLVLPVLRSGDAVTVVLDSPGDLEKLDAVRRYTGATEIEAALASPENIRELIDAVHGTPESTRPVPLARLLAEAVALGATAVGISVRPGRVAGWFRAGEGGATYRPLGPAWAAELEAVVSPMTPPALSPVYAVRSWPAILTLAEGAWRVECHAMGRGEAVEWSATLGRPIPTAVAAAGLEDGLAGDLRAAACAGPVAVRVHPGDDGAAASGREILEAALAALPAAVYGPGVRSLHLSDRPVAVAPGQLYLLAREPLAEALAKAEPFALQALTLDVERLPEDALERALRVAPFVVFHSRAGEPPVLPAGFDLRLRLSGDVLLWSR